MHNQNQDISVVINDFSPGNKEKSYNNFSVSVFLKIIQTLLSSILSLKAATYFSFSGD
jgi:hypothetical protein